MLPVPPIESKLRFAIVMAISMTAAFATRDALAARDAFSVYSGGLAVVMVIGLIGFFIIEKRKSR